MKYAKWRYKIWNLFIITLLIINILKYKSRYNSNIWKSLCYTCTTSNSYIIFIQ